LPAFRTTGDRLPKVVIQTALMSEGRHGLNWLIGETYAGIGFPFRDGLAGVDGAMKRNDRCAELLLDLAPARLLSAPNWSSALLSLGFMENVRSKAVDRRQSPAALTTPPDSRPGQKAVWAAANPAGAGLGLVQSTASTAR